MHLIVDNVMGQIAVFALSPIAVYVIPYKIRFISVTIAIE